MVRFGQLTLIILLVVLFNSWTVNAFAEEIHIVISPFLGYVNEKDAKLTGPIVEVMEAIMKRTHHTYIVETYPWARAYHYMTEDRGNQLMPHLIRNEEREKLFKWVDVVTPMEFWMVKKKTRKDIQINTLEDAKKYKSIVLRQDVTEQYLQKNGFPHILSISSDAQPIKMLELERGDLIIQDRTAFFQLLRNLQLNKDDFELVYQLKDMSRTLWIACSLSTENRIVEDIKSAFKQVKADGTYDTIMSKWGRK